MDTPLLTRVKSQLFVHSRRRSRSLLEGEYASHFHGRSLDYVDLREYVAGDEVRDIDWKATARHPAPLVRRYVATRKQNLLLLVDTGRGMAASAPSGEPKSALAVAACGLVGYLTLRHGDLVGLVHGSAEGTSTTPLRGSEAHLETLLRTVHRSTRLDGPPSDLLTQLRWVVRSVRRRLLLLVVADEREPDAGLDAVLRRLQVQHEILWVTVTDADPTLVGSDREAYEVSDGSGLPAEVRLDPRVRAAHAEALARRRAALAAVLDRRGVNHVRVSSTREVVPAVFSLLERQRRAG